MKKREAWNFVLHVCVALVLVSLVLVHRYFLLLDVFIWMSLREQAQHRWNIGDSFTFDDGTVMYAVEKRTFFDFGWLEWRHVGEVFQGVLGAFLALLAYELLIWMKLVGN